MQLYYARFMIFLLLILAACAPQQTISDPTSLPTPDIPNTATPTRPTATPPNMAALQSIESGSSTVLVRVINAAPTTQGINVTAGFRTIATNVNFGQAAEPVPVNGGETTFQVMPSGGTASEPLLTTTLLLDATDPLLVILISGENGLEMVALPEVIQPLNPDESAVAVVNLLNATAGLQQDSTDVMAQIPPGSIGTSNLLSSGETTLNIQTDGKNTPYPVELKGQEKLTLVLTGTVDDLNILAFSARAPGRAAARTIHASPDLEAVDVYLNDTLMVAGLEYGRPMGRLDFPSGDYILRIYRAGGNLTDEVPLLSQPVSLSAENNTLLIIIGKENNLRIVQGLEDLNPLPVNQVRLSFVNTVETAPTIGVETSGGALPGLPDLVYGDGPTSIQLGTSAYDFQLLRTGTGGDPNRTVEIVQNVQFEPGFYYLYLITGRMDNNPVILSENVGIDERLTITSADDIATQAAAESVQVHFINGLQDQSAVDFRSGEAVAAANINYGTGSDLVEIPQNSIISVSPAGLPDTAAQVGLSVGQRFTIIVYGETLSQAQVMVIDDDRLILDSSPRVRLINLSTNADTLLGLAFSPPDPTPLPDTTAQPRNVDLRRTIPFGVQRLVDNIAGGSFSTSILMPTGLTDLEIIDSSQEKLAFTVFDVVLENTLYNVIAYEEPETTQIEAFAVSHPR